MIKVLHAPACCRLKQRIFSRPAGSSIHGLQYMQMAQLNENHLPAALRTKKSSNIPYSDTVSFDCATVYPSGFAGMHLQDEQYGVELLVTHSVFGSKIVASN
jgi:hypothetical protein